MKKKYSLLRTALAGVLIATLFTSNAFAYVVRNRNSSKAEEQEEVEPADPNDGVLTLGEAIEMATENNSSLRSITDNIEVLKDTKEKLVSRMQGGTVPPDTDGFYFVDDTVLSILQSVNSMENQLSTIEYNQEMLKVAIPMTVKNYFVNIKNNEENLENLKAAYALAQRNYEENKLRFDLGMISEVELKKLQNTLEQTKQGMTQVELGIESDYSGLRRLTGLPESETFLLGDVNADLSPVDMPDSLEAYIERKIQIDPSLKALQDAINTAQFNLDAHNASGAVSGESYKAKEVSLADANRTFAEAKKNMRTNMIKTYNQLLQLEANQKSLEAELKAAEEDLVVAKSNLEVGNITQLAYDQAEYAIDAIKLNLQKNTYSYDLLKYSFENPSLLASAGGSDS